MRKHAGVILSVAVTVVLAARVEAATYSGGSGTEADPYQIGSVADWTILTATSDDWDRYFVLTADIDFGGASLTPVASDTGLELGFQGITFTGFFDGDGHVLSNAEINLPEGWYVGLFGYLDTSGTIRNLGMKNVVVTGSSYVGGIVGWNCGNISLSYISDLSITGTGGTAGGFVGYSNGQIERCYAAIDITGTAWVGGFVGTGDGEIIESFAAGNVVGTGDYVGGFAGYIGGESSGANIRTLTKCFAVGEVTGANHVGGFAGRMRYNSSNITECYSAGKVSGSSYVGGFVGSRRNNEGIVTKSYWDMDTSTTSTSSAGIGLHTYQMYQYASFVDWDFNSVWGIVDGESYPYLLWYENENEGEGELTEGEPAEGEVIEGEGEGETSIEGEVEGELEGEGETPVEGESPAEGEGEVLPEGEGEVLIEGEGEILPEGEGEILIEGEGEVVVEGEGELPPEGEGEALHSFAR
ncbi:MAG: hypothetical protein GXY07_15355 [Candidatus Hydrogenedentes bacterium]|nr:hypothetical protein [Candidatus Hydrogenedentota bacterium]